MSRRLGASFVVASLIGLALAVPAHAVAAGDLDATFGSAGAATLDVNGLDDTFVAVAIQPADQKIVAVGNAGSSSGDDWLIARFNPNGTPDATFGSNGVVTTSFGSGTDHAHAVVIDGTKIVVAGYSDNGTSHDFEIGRYTSTGSPDGTFGSGGFRTTSFGAQDDEINALAIDGSGRYVAVGQTSVSGNNQFALARYTASGSLDGTFGTAGKVKTNIGLAANSDVANAVAIQADGKIIAAGRASNGTDRDLALVRYDSDGTVDTGYATNGKRTTDLGFGDDEITAMALDANGKAVVVGDTATAVNTDFVVARYTTGGSLDGSFGSGGITTTDIGHNDAAYGLGIQGDGMIVVSGTAGSSYFGVARYTTGGVLDGGFGSGGTVYTAISPFGNDGFGMALQADGAVVEVGDAYGTRYDAAVARYLVAPPVPYYQPDEAIRLGTGKWVGDNAYNTTAKRQTITTKAKRGTKKSFTVRIENDGNTADTYTVKGAAAQTGFSVRYLAGGIDVTSTVVAGTYTTSSIAAGSSTSLKVVITVKSSATIGVTRSWLVTSRSVTASTQKDAVKAKVRVGA